jgi:hypothetical protein
MNQEQPRSLNDRLNALEGAMGIDHNLPSRTFIDKLTGKGKPPKEINLPNKVTRGWKKKVKKGYILCLYLRGNGQIEPYWCPTKDGLFYVKPKGEKDGLEHAFGGEFLFNLYNKIPTVIQFEETLKPLSHKRYVEEAQKEGDVSSSQRVIIQAMKKAELEGKKSKFNAMWLLIGLAVIIALYLLNKMINKPA